VASGLRSAERGDLTALLPFNPAAFGSANAFGRFSCVGKLLSLWSVNFFRCESILLKTSMQLKMLDQHRPS
jgi:hypothetical protein